MSRPTIQRFQPEKVGPKVWGTELLVARSPDWTGKVLYMNAGCAGPLQYHEHKHEAFHCFKGQAEVTYEQAGKLVRVTMGPGETWQVPPGAIHKVAAITDCIFFEVSTPHFDDRVNVEAEFGLS